MIDPLEVLARATVAALAIGVAYAAFFAAFVAVTIRTTRASATSRHVLWWLALAASVAVPIGSVASSLARTERHAVPVYTSVAATAREPKPAANGPIAKPAARVLHSSGIAMFDARIARRTIDSVFDYPHAGEAVLAVWALGALGGSLSLLRGFAALRTIKRNSRPLDARIARRLRRFRHRSKMGRAVALRVSDDIDVPVAAGFGKPAILLPARLTADRVAAAALVDLDQIVLHEYAHLERYDDWTNAIQRALERIFWVDPFVAFFGSRIALEREIACDDSVVAQTGHAHRYATCLWKLVEAARLPTRRIAAPGALFSPRQITVRIEQLLDARRNALPRLSPASALVTGAIALSIVVLQAVRAPAIAIDVPVTIAAASAAPTVAVTPGPAPTIAPRVRTTIVLHRIPVAATPDAIARAVAHVVQASTHAAVATTVSRLSTSPHAYTETIGIDVARDVSKAVAPLAPAIANAVAIDVASSIADEMSIPVAAGTARACGGCDLHGVDLRGRDLRGVSWVDADLHGADLRNVDLRGANLSGVDLHGARLDGADLTGARISDSDLHGAKLAGARLYDARLNDTDLDGAILVRADFRNARLVDCEITDDQLAAADTRGARIIRN